MMPGAEPSRRLDLDDERIACGLGAGAVPWGSDDDPADADCGQFGLRAPGPVAVLYLRRFDAHQIALRDRADRLCRRRPRFRAAEVGSPRAWRREIVFLN